MRPWRASALVFGSSAAVLMLETVAGRLMAPYVGVSLETFTGIIGTCLAGIALGAAIGGSIADRRDPRPLIGPTLVLGGALTWASLPILRIVGPAMGTDAASIVVLTSAAFLAPATVLSAVSPAIAKLRLSSLDETGSVVGRLSAAGTFGALAGTFLTGFVLVATLPSSTVVRLIGGVLVLVGVVVTWRLRSGWSPVALVVGTLVAGVGSLLLPPPCDRETAYFCVRVEQDPANPAGRDLLLDRTRHAYVDLDDPTHLELRYVRLIAAVADAGAGAQDGDSPLDTLHLGGGGFTYPGYLRATRPGSIQTVLEIDPQLIDVARDDLGLVDDPDTEILVGDARLHLRELPSDSYDVVVGDAFASTSVPWHLTTVEVMDEVVRLLRPGGVYVMNVIDGGDSRYARAQLATLAARFDHVAAILPVGGVPDDVSVNQVLIASDAPIAEPELAPGDGVFVDEAAAREYLAGAQVLRDDHAPVDQLVMR